MHIEVIEMGRPYKDGNTFKMVMKYLQDGKPTERKLAAVGESQNVFNILKDAVQGQHYEIERKPSADGKFQNWVGATPLEPGQAPASAQKAVKSNYETTEERARRQVLIVRQSCLAQAISAGRVKEGEILELADTFVAWVMKGDEPVEGFPE